MSFVDVVVQHAVGHGIAVFVRRADVAVLVIAPAAVVVAWLTVAVDAVDAVAAVVFVVVLVQVDSVDIEYGF